MNQNQKTWGIIWRCLVLIFLFFMAYAIVKGYVLLKKDFEDFDKYSAFTEGVVIEVIYETMSGGGSREIADYKVRFETQEGVEVIFFDNTALDLGVVQGQTVPVKYMPDDPDYARIELVAQHTNTNAILWMYRVFMVTISLLLLFSVRGLFRYIKKSIELIGVNNDDDSF